ncbi:hypothetical protein [Pseudomonas savastanoi]|uniref:hypothetical protein n=1 Tax=Pseudomonas savastanoi TaxID=29438 RepID=UPI000E32B0C0|nr:hypothetical protein [Pseudomonas savastanoi]
MERSLLTPEDQEWLQQLANATRKGCDFILYDFTKRSNALDQRRAGEVPIWHSGAYTSACDVLESIRAKVPYSQIFEQWESRLYQDVVRECAQLSVFDARVLLMASGFHLKTEEDISRAAAQAVSEAYEDLYGSSEDAYDDNPV